MHFVKLSAQDKQNKKYHLEKFFHCLFFDSIYTSSSFPNKMAGDNPANKTMDALVVAGQCSK